MTLLPGRSQGLSWIKEEGENRMRREGTLEEISDGRLYDLNDMVKADCRECEGCSECCRGTGDTVILDPLDVNRLSLCLKKTPEKLMEEELVLDVADGNILPHLRARGKEERCVFLDNQGRCSVHPARPGICRLFPLGRFYENGGFRYFLQIHECPKPNRGKIKVKKWIDMPDARRYDKFVSDWHYFLKDVQEVLYDAEDTELIKNLNLYVVNRFYIKPYEPERDFYGQFYERLKEGRELLALA